jgi:hypothetical protein
LQGDTAATRAVLLPVLLTVALAAAGIFWAAPRAAHGNFGELLLGALAVQSIWILLRWRLSVHAFMVYVVFEGFLINYLVGFPQLNLVKDVFLGLLFVALAVHLIPRGDFPVPRFFWVPVFIAFGVVYAVQVFNPHLPNILVGLVGLRVTLLYFLMVPIAYWFFESRERALHFLKFMVGLSVPVAVFGIVQYFMGPAWMISLSPGFERAVFYAYGLDPQVENRYFRTFSTFVHTGGFSQYLALLMLLTVASWPLTRTLRHRVFLFLVFTVQFLALLTTGGRTSLIVFLSSLVLWLVLQRGTIRLAPVLALLPVLFMVMATTVGPGFLDRFASLLDLEYVQERNIPLLTGWFEESMKADWTGLGAGYASVASRHVGITPLNVSVVENGLAKMRFEAGLLGLILYTVLLICLMYFCARQAFRVTDPGVRWFSSACAAYVIVNVALVPIGTPFDVSPTNIYLWFFVGFLGRAPSLVAIDPAETGPSGP